MQRYVQWDVRNWSRALDFWIETCRPSAFSGADVLEVGSRDGGLSLWFAEQGAARVVCSDLGGPSAAARALHADSGESDRVEYAAIDATEIGLEDAFDVVAFKSVLGGIGGAGGFTAQERAVRSMYGALRPGGVLLLAENLVASPLHRYLRRRFVPWADRWRYVTIREMHGFLAAFSQVQSRTFGFAGAFGRNERQRSSLAKVDVAGLDRVVPADWRYIIAGVATK
jgi:SAM-dependent methyltransferase